MALSDDVTALETDLKTLKTDVEATVNSTEDPAWTAVKEALTSNGWAAPTPTSTDTPNPSSDTVTE